MQMLSAQQVVVLTPGFHGMDDKLVPAVEAEHDEFKQPAGWVEAEPKLACRALFVKVADVHRVLGREDAVIWRDSVLEGGVVNLHAT